MTDRRTIFALMAGALVLLLTHVAILGKESVLRDGRTVLLALAPLDPRSLVQGDYMALRFALADQIMLRLPMTVSEDGAVFNDGWLVLRNDAHGVAQFVRHDDGSALAGDEFRLRYRVRHGEVKFATNAFFFQEGTAHRYANAHYGEFRVNEDGEAILVGLRD